MYLARCFSCLKIVDHQTTPETWHSKRYGFCHLECLLRYCVVPPVNCTFITYDFSTYFKNGQCVEGGNVAARTPLEVFQEMDAVHNFPTTITIDSD